MPTITKSALQWLQDELESKDATITDLESELEDALDEAEILRAELLRMRATLEVA